MKISIEPCREEHLNAVLVLAANTDEIGDYEGETYAFFSHDRLRLMAASPDVLFLVAKADRHFAGFFLLTVQRASGMGYIVDMALEDRFQRLGIGQMFVRAGLEFAEKEGCEEVWCIVQEQNERAWKLFKKMGFRSGKKFYFVGKTLAK